MSRFHFLALTIFFAFVSPALGQDSSGAAATRTYDLAYNYVNLRVEVCQATDPSLCEDELLSFEFEDGIIDPDEFMIQINEFCDALLEAMEDASQPAYEAMEAAVDRLLEQAEVFIENFNIIAAASSSGIDLTFERQCEVPFPLHRSYFDFPDNPSCTVTQSVETGLLNMTIDSSQVEIDLPSQLALPLGSNGSSYEASFDFDVGLSDIEWPTGTRTSETSAGIGDMLIFGLLYGDELSQGVGQVTLTVEEEPARKQARRARSASVTLPAFPGVRIVAGSAAFDMSLSEE